MRFFRNVPWPIDLWTGSVRTVLNQRGLSADPVEVAKATWRSDPDEMIEAGVTFIGKLERAARNA